MTIVTRAEFAALPPQYDELLKDQAVMSRSKQITWENLELRDPGFVQVVDERTLAFPNYDGNGMYLSMGNLAATHAVGLLFIDFERQRRLRVATKYPEITRRHFAEKGAQVDKHGRPALANGCKAPTLFWSKPLGDPLGGTDLANGRHPVKMETPEPPDGAPEARTLVLRGFEAGRRRAAVRIAVGSVPVERARQEACCPSSWASPTSSWSLAGGRWSSRAGRHQWWFA